MLRLLFILSPLSLLFACSANSNDVNVQEQIKKDTTSQPVIFDAPRTIDSSPIVVYPLILQKNNAGGGYLSSSRGSITSYWNLVFYNTETQRQNLLTDKKILIYSINFAASNSSSSNDNWARGINIFRDHIVYSAVAKDFNNNKQLDQDDPTYLFISNRDGMGFRQISPEGYNIVTWEVLKGTGKFIMQGQKDGNADKVFNEHDALVPLVVDINSSSPAVETFNQNYIDSLKQKLVEIWK